MLSRLKAQFQTWYLRYYFFYDPLKYQVITNISRLLFRSTPSDDRSACREVLYLLKHSSVGEVLQPLLGGLFTVLAESNGDQWIAQYYRVTDLPSEEHREHVLALKRNLDLDQVVSLHTELVALYKANECQQILDLLAVIYQQVPIEIFWLFWDEATDIAHLDERYPFAAKGAQRAITLDETYWGNYLENARVHYPIQRCLIDALITRSDFDLLRDAARVANFYHLALRIDANHQENWEFYARGCGCLQALGFQPPPATAAPALVFSQNFIVTAEAVQRYQTNLRTVCSAPSSDFGERVGVYARFGMQ